MDTVEVYRGDGSHRGSDVIAPLLADSVLIDRGVAEMNRNAHYFNEVTLGLVALPMVRLGKLCQVSDPTSDRLFLAKVTAISISVSHASVEATIDLERPS